MRSYCQCRLEHRNGKSFEGLPVEIMLISEPLTSDALAICQLHELQRYLLFPTFRRADLVYTPPQDSSSLDIALKSYDESLVQFTFSSRENKDTWAAKFAEMFPPAPALPPGVKPQIASLAGLQIISADKDSNEKIQLQTDELDSELQRPRLFEEPELRPYIVQTDISPQKKRHSLFRYGSSNSISKSTTFSKPSVRFSRIVSESRISPSSSSSTLSPYRRLQQRLVEKQRSVSAIAPLPSVQSMVLKEETPSTSPELSRSPSVPPRSSSVANSRGAISERRSSLMTAVNNSFLKAKMSSSELETKKGETTTSVVIAKLKDEEPAKTEESKPKELKPKDTLPELNSASLKKPVSANSVSYKDTPAAGIYLVPMSANEGTAASPQPHLKSISSPANRESVSSITPEVFTVSPLTQEYTAESPRIEEQQSTAHRKKSSFAFGRKPKEYVLDENAGVPATRSGSVSSVFRKFTPRSQLSISGRKTPGHPADNAENDKAISAVYSRLSRRASTALTSLSPNVGSPNPATTPTVESPILSGALGSPASTTSEFSANSVSKQHKRAESAGFMRSLRFSKMSLRSSSASGSASPALESVPLTTNSASETPVVSAPSRPTSTTPVRPATEETSQESSKPDETPVVEQFEPTKTKKFSIFARNARKMRAALQAEQQQQQQPQQQSPSTAEEDEFAAPVDIRSLALDSGTTTITTIPPSPSAEIKIIDVAAAEEIMTRKQVDAQEDVTIQGTTVSAKDKTDSASEETTASANVVASADSMLAASSIAVPTSTGGDETSVYDDAQDDFPPMPKVQPLKISVNNLLEPEIRREFVLSQGYPPSPLNDVVDNSIFVNDRTENSTAKRTKPADTASGIKTGSDPYDTLSSKSEYVVFRDSMSTPSSAMMPTFGDETPIPPPSPLRVPSRTSQRGSSISRRSSRTSTLRDSQVTVYADAQHWLVDPSHPRYSLRDEPVSDDGEEEEVEKVTETRLRSDSVEEDYYSVVDMSESSGAASDDEKSEDTVDEEEKEVVVAATSAVKRTTLKYALEERTALKPKSINSLIPGNYSLLRPNSPLKKEFALSSSPESTSDTNVASSPAMKWSTQDDNKSDDNKSDDNKSDDNKTVLFKSNALVFEWNNNKWERITPQQVRVMISVTDGTGNVEVWSNSSSPSSSISSSGTTTPECTTPSSDRPPKTRSVMFTVAGDTVLNLNESLEDGKPMLAIPLSTRSSVRRSTAFDVHLKRTETSGMTMFRMRTAADADHMISVMNACKVNFRATSIRSRQFGSSAPSIASSESSISSGASLLFGSGQITAWHHPVLDSTLPRATESIFADGADEVMIVRDFNCRLFLRQDALKWRNIGPAKISVSAISQTKGNKVCVTLEGEQVVFDLPIGRSDMEKLGKTGISICVDEEVPDSLRSFASSQSKLAVYMLQVS